MGKGGQGVARQLQFGALAPCCIRTLTGNDGRITGIVRVRLTLGQIHRPSVGRQATGTLVPVAVQLCVNHLGTLPFPLVILL